MANEEHLARLRVGAAAWNAWRKEHSDVAPDLRKADLSEADLSGANLSGANLSGANLSETNFTGGAYSAGRSYTRPSSSIST